jgi:hypothetical protein
MPAGRVIVEAGHRLPAVVSVVAAEEPGLVDAGEEGIAAVVDHDPGVYATMAVKVGY